MNTTISFEPETLTVDAGLLEEILRAGNVTLHPMGLPRNVALIITHEHEVTL